MTTYSAKKLQDIQSLGLPSDLQNATIRSAFLNYQIKPTDNLFIYLEKIQYTIGNIQKVLYIPSQNVISSSVNFPLQTEPSKPTNSILGAVGPKTDGDYIVTDNRDFEGVIVSIDDYNYIKNKLESYLATFDKESTIIDIPEFIKKKTIPGKTFVEHCEMVYCLLLKNCTSIYSVDDDKTNNTLASLAKS
jgi:hypothetical protein